MTKTEQILQQTCPTCQSFYQLIETQQGSSCALNCLTKWKQTLHEYYQQQIILHLAQAEDPPGGKAWINAVILFIN